MTVENAVETLAPESLPEDGEVLITIGTSDSPGIIRRWGTVAKAVGDLSLEAIVRGAVDPRVLELVHKKRPSQYETEIRVAGEIKAILEHGYRIFVHDGDTPVDSSRAAQLKARELLKQAAPEYETQTFFTLHLILERYGRALGEEHARQDVDEAAAAEAGDAFAHELAGDEELPEAPKADTPADEAEDEVVLAADEPQADQQAEAAEAVQPQPNQAEPAAGPRLSKQDVLREQFTEKVKALDFRGLFVGNFGFQKDAVVDVNRLSTLSPQTISAYLMKANSFRQNGEHEKALSYYRVLLKSDPDNADFRFLYGKTLLEMGRTQAAEECLQRARELGHESAQRELDHLTEKQTRKSGFQFLRFWRRDA